MTATGPTTIPKVRRVRVYTRLSQNLRKRLAEYCAAAGRSERAVIEDAVGQYLSGHSNALARTPLERLAEAIDSDRRQGEQLHRLVEILSESFGAYLRLWLVVHAPTLQERSTAASADALAKQRAAAEDVYRRFVARIAEQFRNGHRFIHDLRTSAAARRRSGRSDHEGKQSHHFGGSRCRSRRTLAATDSRSYRLHEPRSRREPRVPADSRAWTDGQPAVGCCSGVVAVVTVMWPMGSASSRWSSRARVAAQNLGASSRYRSRGQYGKTRKMSVR